MRDIGDFYAVVGRGETGKDVIVRFLPEGATCPTMLISADLEAVKFCLGHIQHNPRVFLDHTAPELHLVRLQVVEIIQEVE